MVSIEDSQQSAVSERDGGDDLLLVMLPPMTLFTERGRLEG